MTALPHVGELASSKSAMKTLAPELSALMTIFRSTGPVISTRRSSRSRGMGATVQSASRTPSGRRSRKSGKLAGVDRLLPLDARGEQRLASRVELAHERLDELQRLRGEDDLTTGRHRGLELETVGRRRGRHGRPPGSRENRGRRCRTAATRRVALGPHRVKDELPTAQQGARRAFSGRRGSQRDSAVWVRTLTSRVGKVAPMFAVR